MGAAHLLGPLRRVRWASAAALFHTFHNPGFFPQRGGAFSSYSGSSLPARAPTHRYPVPAGWRLFSSWGEPAGHDGLEDGATGNGEVSVGGSVLPPLGIDGGEDSAWYAPVRAIISLLDGYHEATGLPWWIIIATSTLALRVSLLPVLFLQFKKMQKLSELFPK